MTHDIDDVIAVMLEAKKKLEAAIEQAESVRNSRVEIRMPPIDEELLEEELLELEGEEP